MTTVPPPGAPSLQMAAPPSAGPTAVIQKAPAALAALPPGTVLEAIVVPTPAQDAAAKALVTLRTAAGDVTLKLPAQLPANSTVALEVLRTSQAQNTQPVTPAAPDPAAQDELQGPQVTVRVLTIDAQPAAQVLAQLSRQANAAEDQTAGPAQETQTSPESPNPLLRAMLLPPGLSFTVFGPQPVTALGTVSAFVMTSPGAEAAAVDLGNQPQTPNAPAADVRAAASAILPPAGGELAMRVIDVALPAAMPASPSGAVTPMPGVQSTNPTPIPSGENTAPVNPISQPPLPGAPVIATTAPPDVVALNAAAPVLDTEAPLNTEAPSIAPGSVAAPPPDALSVGTQPAPAGPVLAGAEGLPPSAPSPPLQIAPALATMNGVVIGSAAGAPIVETDAGQLQLNIRANLPAGTQLSFEILERFDPPPGLPASPPVPAAALPLSTPPGVPANWPTLTESLALLQRADPGAAQVLIQAIPDGGPRTVVALIAFAQAMRSGDGRQWPGDDTLRALERISPRGAHLASQLSDEVSALSGRAREPTPDWRALPMPWNAEGRIDRIALITRREGEGEDGGGRKGGGQRFLINLELSRLGALQLDGMFRKESKSFDMMIRARAALPDTIRLDLIGLFAASNAAMGLTGGLTFQVVKTFANPLGRTPAADRSGLWA